MQLIQLKVMVIHVLNTSTTPRWWHGAFRPVSSRPLSSPIVQHCFMAKTPTRDVGQAIWHRWSQSEFHCEEMQLSEISPDTSCRHWKDLTTTWISDSGNINLTDGCGQNDIVRGQPRLLRAGTRRIWGKLKAINHIPNKRLRRNPCLLSYSLANCPHRQVHRNLSWNTRRIFTVFLKNVNISLRLYWTLMTV